MSQHLKTIETMDLPLVALNLMYMARDKRDKGRADELIKAHTAAFEAGFHLGGRFVTLSVRERVEDALKESLYHCDAALLDLESDEDRCSLARLVADLEAHREMNRNAMDHVRDDGKEPYEAEHEDE